MKKLVIGLAVLVWLYSLSAFADSSATIVTDIKIESAKKNDSRPITMWMDAIFIHHSQEHISSIGNLNIGEKIIAYPKRDTYLSIDAIQVDDKDSSITYPKIYLSDCNNLNYIMRENDHAYVHIKLIDDSHAICEVSYD